MYNSTNIHTVAVQSTDMQLQEEQKIQPLI